LYIIIVPFLLTFFFSNVVFSFPHVARNGAMPSKRDKVDMCKMLLQTGTEGNKGVKVEGRVYTYFPSEVLRAIFCYLIQTHILHLFLC
jgi:hypothetical protein